MGGRPHRHPHLSGTLWRPQRNRSPGFSTFTVLNPSPTIHKIVGDVVEDATGRLRPLNVAVILEPGHYVTASMWREVPIAQDRDRPPTVRCRGRAVAPTGARSSGTRS